MLLRDSKVFARSDESGNPIASDGRVEIRYKKGDSKSYQAGLRNLTAIEGAELIHDDEFGAGTPAEPKSKSKTKKSSGAAKSAGDPIVHPENAVIAYADGACSGNPGPAGLGVVAMNGDERVELSEYLGVGTNNIAELTAIQRVAERFSGSATPVHVYTDSSYSIGVLTKNWKAKANQELIASVKSAMRKVPSIELHYVPGHAGVALNERADELARAAVVARMSAPWTVVRSAED